MKNTNLVKAILVVTALVSVCALTACSALGQAQPIAGTQSGVLAAEAAVRSAGGLQTPAGTQAPGANRLEQIQARGYIEVATEPYFAPCEFIDPAKEGDEKYVGADIELAKLIAETLGVECRIVPLEFTAVLSSVTEGKYDMAISALAYTPARAEAMDMSKGYYYSQEEIQYGLLVRTEDLGAIGDADDLADQTVVVQSGSLQELFAFEQVPAYKELKRVSATTDGFLMVQENKADACHGGAVSGGQSGMRHGHRAGLRLCGGRGDPGRPHRRTQGGDRAAGGHQSGGGSGGRGRHLYGMV